MTQRRNTPHSNAPHAQPNSRFGWQSELSKILAEHNHRASGRNKNVGFETQKKRQEILFSGFRELRELGFRIENPQNFQERHIKALAKYWEESGLSPATIQNKISIFRVFAEWINKPNMIKNSEDYVADPKSVRRSYVATKDKSWSTQGVDPIELIERINNYDPYAGLQLLVMNAFGLRRREAIQMKPHRADKGEYLLVTDGTKGDRARTVRIDSDFKRQVLEYAKAMAKTVNGHIGYPGRTLEQSIKRFANIMTKFGISKGQLGVTSHGLRHEYLNDLYERITGNPSPVRGGDPSAIDKETEALARSITSEEAGHSRINVTATYYGSFRRRVPGSPAPSSPEQGNSASDGDDS